MTALPGLLATVAPYLDRYGDAAVGGLLLLESFGLPVPGETVLIAAAVYAGTGRLNIVAVAVIAFVAAVAGGSPGWLLGPRGGGPPAAGPVGRVRAAPAAPGGPGGEVLRPARQQDRPAGPLRRRAASGQR